MEIFSSLSLTVQPKKTFKVDCYLPCKSTKVTSLQFSMLVTRTNITEDKIILRYEESGVRPTFFFNSVTSINP